MLMFKSNYVDVDVDVQQIKGAIHGGILREPDSWRVIAKKVRNFEWATGKMDETSDYGWTAPAVTTTEDKMYGWVGKWACPLVERIPKP